MSEERHRRFIDESNAIEDICIRYSTWGEVGHPSALHDALTSGAARQELSLSRICQWQAALVNEQLAAGYSAPPGAAGKIRSIEHPCNVRIGDYIAPSYQDVPGRLDSWLRETNAQLLGVGHFISDAAFATLLGDQLQRFEALHPFADGNGRTGRLCCAFMAAWCRRAVPIFHASDRINFYNAHSSRLAMRIYLAELIREAVIWPGRGTLERLQRGTHADTFDGLVIERHELLRAVGAWTGELERRARDRVDDATAGDE